MTKWQCPYCGKVHEENQECCGEMHCFEFDTENQCPKCGSGDTKRGKQTDANGECSFLMCYECSHMWDFS